MYKATIEESNRQFTAKERINFKDTKNATSLDKLIVPDESMVITPIDWALLDIENDRSENKNYKVFVIKASDGEKYSTSSMSFIESFLSIYEEMAGEDEEWELEVYKVPSKKYAGKYFITCSIK